MKTIEMIFTKDIIQLHVQVVNANFKINYLIFFSIPESPLKEA